MTQSELDRRNKLHSDIILYTVKLNQFNGDFDLKLKVPIDFDYSYYIPYLSEDGKKSLKILGVDGTTGELIYGNQDGEFCTTHYNMLTLEELIRLHRSVLQGEYVLQLLNKQPNENYHTI
jgi:hypothetical protein